MLILGKWREIPADKVCSWGTTKTPILPYLASALLEPLSKADEPAIEQNRPANRYLSGSCSSGSKKFESVPGEPVFAANEIAVSTQKDD